MNTKPIKLSLRKGDETCMHAYPHDWFNTQSYILQTLPKEERNKEEIRKLFDLTSDRRTDKGYKWVESIQMSMRHRSADITKQAILDFCRQYNYDLVLKYENKNNGERLTDTVNGNNGNSNANTGNPENSNNGNSNANTVNPENGRREDIEIEENNRQNVKEFTENLINQNKKENQENQENTKTLTENLINENGVSVGMIIAPTQSGKTDATAEQIKTCTLNRVSVIVSCDNKTDQMEQIYERISKKLLGDNTRDIILVKVSDRNFEEKIEKNKDKVFVIFCLDNSSQVNKITRLFCSWVIKNIRKTEKIMIIHDEGDVIQKDNNVETKTEGQSKVHQKWIELCDLIEKKYELKRTFITATPENCWYLYKNIYCKNILRLQQVSYYKGWEEIKYNELESEMDVLDILQRECDRIKNNTLNETGEVILYSVERNVEKGETNQTKIFDKLSSTLKNITINLYNSKGITVDTQNEVLKILLKNEKIKKITQKRNGVLQLSKDFPIRKFYNLCKQAGEKVVITIGKDLINRGISYVSEGENPLAATTMIYIPGKTVHAVGVNQAVGRITGKARTDLQRTLYAPIRVIEEYKNYNMNQEEKLREIKINPEKTTYELFGEEYDGAYKINKLDRDVLKIRVKEQSEDETDEYNSDDKIDGVSLETLRKWIQGWKRNERSIIIVQLLMYVYENRSINITHEKLFEEKYSQIHSGDWDSFQANIRNGSSERTQNGKLWISLNNNIKINPNIVSKIEEILDE